MRSRIAFAGLFILALVAFPGCSKKSNPTAPQPVNPADVNAVVQAAGKLQPLCANKDSITSSQSHDEGSFRYVTETHDAANNFDQLTYLGVNDDVIWPGALIKGERAHQFVYEPVVGVTRNPVTLSINLEGSGSGAKLSTTAYPNLSTVRDSISMLLNRVIASGATYAAKADFEKTQVYSETHLNLVVGADLKYGGATVNTRFDWASTTKKNKIIAKYQQLYYSIDMNTPTSPCNVFAADNSLDAIRAAIPQGSCPMYVASVVYGMMALTFIETDYSQTDLEASLDAAYSNLPLDVEVHTGVTKRDILASSTIKTVVYGGASAGLNQIETGYDGFIRVVHASIQLGTASPGVPLIYKFRHLCDNLLAQVTMTSQYSLTRVIRLEQMIRVTLDRFVCEWANDDCGDDVLEMNHFRVWVNATQRAGQQAPVNYWAADTLIYEYYDGEGWGVLMNDGDVHTVGRSVVLWFDAEHFDYNLATIKVRAWCHDVDPSFLCIDRNSSGEITVAAPNFGANPHTFQLQGAGDYVIRCEVKIELANVPARQVAMRRT